MRRIVLIAATVVLGACGGDDKVECAASSSPNNVCSGNKVYVCPPGNPEDVKSNEAVTAACMAKGGNDSAAIADCMNSAGMDGKYRMVPGQFVEDCAASGKICDVFTDACVTPPPKE